MELVIAGTGEEQSSIEQLASGLALGGRTHLAGRVEGQTKLYLLQNARCVIMPSQEWEAFPLVLMESFAAGQPVIGSRIPGIREHLADGQTGLLFNEGDVAALAAAIARLWANPAEADAMVQMPRPSPKISAGTPSRQSIGAVCGIVRRAGNRLTATRSGARS